MPAAIRETTIPRRGTRSNHRETLQSFIVAAGEPKRRGMMQFAEEEIVLGEGPYPGRFRGERQPFSRLLFAEIDSGHWTDINVVGCVQSGKTTICYVIPTLYHLFELREKTICGIPDLRLAGEKWITILKPAIERTRYREFMPDRGDGSKDGDRVQTVRFRNRATLRFMSGQGGDTQRSSETTRVMIITEVDKMDHISSVSEEGSKIDQFIDRTKAWDDKALVYKECTPSTAQGRIWQDYMLGSQSRIALCCWYCEQWIVPSDTDTDTELLTGWKTAADEIEAGEKGAFACPHCLKPWSESERKEMNLAAVLLHKGQRIVNVETSKRQNVEISDDETRAIPGSEDVVVGPLPRTRILGFRFSAINNFMRTASSLAAEEWRYAHAADEESAQRTRLQKLWGLPHKPDITVLAPITCDGVQRRIGTWGRGTVPEGTVCVSAGVDLGKWRAFYVNIAWYRGETQKDSNAETPQLLFGHIFEYGVIDVPTIDLGGKRPRWWHSANSATAAPRAGRTGTAYCTGPRSVGSTPATRRAGTRPCNSSARRARSGRRTCSARCTAGGRRRTRGGATPGRRGPATWCSTSGRATTWRGTRRSTYTWWKSTWTSGKRGSTNDWPCRRGSRGRWGCTRR